VLSNTHATKRAGQSGSVLATKPLYAPLNQDERCDTYISSAYSTPPWSQSSARHHVARRLRHSPTEQPYLPMHARAEDISWCMRKQMRAPVARM